MLPIIEIAFGCYMVCCMFIAIWYGFAQTTVPFLMIFAGGYFYVGFGSIWAMWQMSQEGEEEVTEIAELPA